MAERQNKMINQFFTKKNKLDDKNGDSGNARDEAAAAAPAAGADENACAQDGGREDSDGGGKVVLAVTIKY